uniref:Secreted protein n=1 Tax=Setaria viridis TaxID=4556 RepID=A0A4V6D6E4_SETVI|nr:hypothetical protein SEVIR_5G144350v2 [Setaria viridis]
MTVLIIVLLLMKGTGVPCSTIATTRRKLAKRLTKSPTTSCSKEQGLSPLRKGGKRERRVAVVASLKRLRLKGISFD